MSYDLMVFDQSAAPRERAAFLTWYRTQMQTAAANPSKMTGNLRASYAYMCKSYVPMNGPDAYDFQAADAYATLTPLARLMADLRGRKPVIIDEVMLADYSFGPLLLYMSFAWSQANDARACVFNAVLSTDVGFFDVSADAGMISYGSKDFCAQTGF